MADLLLSQLSMDSGFGLPDELRFTNDTVRGEGYTWMDQSTGATQRVAGQALMGDHTWALHNQLSSDDFNERDGSRIVFNYAIEQVGVVLQRMSSMELEVAYQPMTNKERCLVTTKGGKATHGVMSIGEAEDTLESHTHGVNASLNIGLSREIVHTVSAKQGPQLDALFVRMWLLHLSVLSGADVSMVVSMSAMKARLNDVRVEDECDRAKLVKGIRINGKDHDNLAVALIAMAASNFDAVVGLHARVARYRFPTLALTVYGINKLGNNHRTLRNPRMTATTIVDIANRFNQLDACGKALRTALFMFGVTNAGECMNLACADVDLHEDTHVAYNANTTPYMRCNELSEARLLSLAMFMGKAIDQVWGHILRASMLHAASTDVDDARDIILPTHTSILCAAGKTFDKVTASCSIFLDSSDYIFRNHIRLWDSTGIMHALAGGMLIANSVAEEAIQVMNVPQVQALSQTDDPGFAKQLRDDWSVLSLLEELLMRGGENLRGSNKARLDAMGGQLTLSQDVRILCGAQVRFTLLGMGQVVTITRGNEGFIMLPDKDGFELTEPMLTVDTDLSEAAVTKAPERAGSEDIDELLSKYVPPESVISRRPGVQRTVVRPTKPAVAGEKPATNAAYGKLLKDEWEIKETSGDGLLCGARALSTGLVTVEAGRGGKAPSYTTILEALRATVTSEEAQLIRDAGITAIDRDFTADQLAIALQSLGDYQLEIISEDRTGEVTSYRHGSGRPDAITVPIHNKAGHWSGIGPK